MYVFWDHSVLMETGVLGKRLSLFLTKSSALTTNITYKRFRKSKLNNFLFCQFNTWIEPKFQVHEIRKNSWSQNPDLCLTAALLSVLNSRIYQENFVAMEAGVPGINSTTTFGWSLSSGLIFNRYFVRLKKNSACGLFNKIS